MIVTDEEKIMRQCLDKISTIIDAIAIDFNGRGSKTPEIIKKFAAEKKLPLSLRYTKWVDDFGISRTDVMDQASLFVNTLRGTQSVDSKDKSGAIVTKRKPSETTSLRKPTGPMTADEWKLFITPLKEVEPWYVMNHDADNEVTNYNFLDKNELKADLITVDMCNGESGNKYSYRWMVKVDPAGKKKWKWNQPLHEYLDADGGWSYTAQKVEKVLIMSGRFGLRSQDGDHIKYLKDALVFRKWRSKPENKNDRRSLFYEGNSWRDAGMIRNAYDCYIELGKYDDGFAEERYLALYNAGIIAQSLFPENPWRSTEILHKAHEVRPIRLEAIYSIVKFHRQLGNNRAGWDLAKTVVNNPPVNEILWIDPDIYGWKLFDEAGVCAFHSNGRQEAKALFERALQSNRVPDGDRKRMTDALAPQYYK